MDLGFKVKNKVQKPVKEVFDAVYDPDKLSGYFTTGGASGPLDKGSVVRWAFADNPGDERSSFPVKVQDSVKNELIVLNWEGAEGLDTKVEMFFEADGPDETIVTIAETGWRDTQADLDHSYISCFGWAQMLSALKAFVEYGINLRKGAYSGLYKASENDKKAAEAS